MSAAGGASARSRRPRFGAERFERIYARSSDPWDYEGSAYERAKYADTLAALPDRPIARALEVGCSIGVFTELLAPRCGELVAIDFSARALALASKRLARRRNVTVLEASFPEQAPPGPWDLIVCSEVLYYLDGGTLRRAIEWLSTQLRSGASVLAVSWRGEGAQEPLRGDEAHDLVASELSPWHAFDGREGDGVAYGDGAALRDDYRIDRFDG